ncbi:MAG: SNF2-related protein [Deltaproteobacteria bacterium]|nr:SNF2-related protein [Deltaproteobacteria bacterium]
MLRERPYWYALYADVPDALELPSQFDPEVRESHADWLAGGARGRLLDVPKYQPTQCFWSRLGACEILPSGALPDPRIMWRLGSWQPEGAEFLNTRVAALLGDEQAAGKAVMSSLAIPYGASVIYVCRATGVHDQARKIQAWRPDMLVSKWRRQDFVRWPQPAEVAVISMDSLPRPRGLSASDPVERRRAAVERMLPRGRWGGVLILDEVDKLSTPRTHRRLAAEAIARRASRRWGLTGTPMSNVPENLKEVLKLLGLFRCAFHSEAEFDELLGVQRGREEGEHGGRSRGGNVSPVVRERMQRVYLRRTWRDLGGLDEPRFIRTAVDIDHAYIDELIAAAGGLAAVLERVKHPGFGDISEMARLRQGLALAKLPVAVDRVRAHLEEGAPVIVYCYHVEPLHQLQRALGRDACGLIVGSVSVARRDKVIAGFCAGRTPVVAISGAGEDTIDLIRRDDIPYQALVRIDISWAPRSNGQVVGRARRPGMRWPLIVEDLIADHALEHHVHAIVEQKESVMRAAGIL